MLKTYVRITADPAATGNMHRIEARGRFGRFIIEFNLHPSLTNPRTSYLAVVNAIKPLRKLTEPIWIGGLFRGEIQRFSWYETVNLLRLCNYDKLVMSPKVGHKNDRFFERFCA